MLILIQLIKLFGKESIESWCELIAQDTSEAVEFGIILADNGVDLTGQQLARLVRVCQNGAYKSALALS